MQTAAAYIRVSTDDQLEFSPDSQIKAIRDYAKRNDMFLPDEYLFMDDGKSGRTVKKRSAFTKMIAIAKSKPKPFDTILVWKFSRFARNREDSIVYKSMLRKQCGISVVSISESIGDDKMSILFEAMIEAMDEYYSINLAEEVKRGMTQKATTGGILSIPPYGYKIEKGIYVPVPHETEIVKKVFNDYLSGDGFLKIAKALNSMNIKTHRGNPIENRTIEYWLNNPTYIGKIRWNPEGKTSRNYNCQTLIVTDGEHEPIIDIALWNAVQERLKTQKQKHIKHRRTPATELSHWLVGVVRCRMCGAVNGNVGGHFTCSKKCKGLCEGDGFMSVNKMEKIFLNELEGIIKNDVKDIVISMPEVITEEKDSEQDMLKLRIERIKIRHERIKEAYEAGIDTLEEYRLKKENIALELKNAEAELKHCLEKKSNFPKADTANTQKKILNVIDILKSPDVSNNKKNGVVKSIVCEIIKTGDKNAPLLITFRG